MRGSKILAGALLAFCLGWGALADAQAHSVSKGNLVIDHPYATPSLKGVNNVAAYFRGIQNQGDKPDRLLGASSPLATRVEMHRMTLNGNVMRMREVSAIDLPARATAMFRHKSGEYHLMLVGLEQPLKDGDRFDLTLKFERAGQQTVNVWVQTLRDAQAEDHKH